MRALTDAQDWIIAYHLPPYAPNLHAFEGIWPILRRTTQANTAFTDPDHSSAGYDTDSVGSNTVATSSTDASPAPDAP